MNEREIIGAAIKGFDHQLHTSEYKKIHSDDEQLEKLIQMTTIYPKNNYLDLGTGNGYIAFSLAERFMNSFVYGLDISSDSIKKNTEIVKEHKILNARFNSYDGFDFPFEDEMFSGSFSRYAFHHFPNADKSISEIRRTLKPNGFFIFSDPQTLDDDLNGFVDEFQSNLPDGHVHFYRREEIESHFRRFGFYVEKEFESSVRFPRIMNDNYDKLIDKTEESVIEKYKIEVVNDKIYITVKVMNILFRKI